MSQASSSSIKRQCEHCAQHTHIAAGCPYMNTKCRIPGCNGSRNLLVSTTDKNLGRKLLKCHLTSCNGFQWLDHAILASFGYKAPYQGCYICGDPRHWMKDCKWNSLVCGKNGCAGRKWLRISSKPRSAGRWYLKCYTCEAFEWVKEDLAGDPEQPISVQQPLPVPSSSGSSSSGYAAKVVNEVVLDGLCVKFETHISFKKEGS